MFPIELSDIQLLGGFNQFMLSFFGMPKVLNYDSKRGNPILKRMMITAMRT